MTTQVVQRDFSAGEVSPKLIMREDADIYRRGALEVTNFLPTPQGSLVRAPGTRYLQEIRPTATFDWDYQGDSVANAAAGQLVYDSAPDPDVLRVSYTDNDAADRQAFLASLSAGDTFTFGAWTATIVSTTDDSANSQYVFEVTLTGSAPAAGVETLTFEGPRAARIVPYLTSANERSLLLFTTLGVDLIRNITERLETDTAGLGGDPTPGTTIISTNVVSNPSFYRGLEDWIGTPEATPARGSEAFLGVYMDENLDNTVRMVPRLYKYNNEPTVVTLEGSAQVEYATDSIVLDYLIKYLENPPQNLGGFTFNVVISKNADYSTPVYDETYTQADYGAGDSFNPLLQSVSVGAGYTGPLYFKMTATATTTSELDYSNPHFGVFYFRIFANKEITLSGETATDAYPYTTAADLEDIHYVQSPYGDKELIVTHPNHQVHRFWFDVGGGGTYKFDPVPFTGAPGVWAPGNYPATCTSYQGRLILAGSQSFRSLLGSPIGTAAETIWGTDPGDWKTFTATVPAVASDGIEVTTIYRSPIQWAYGQNSLLIGALEFEYSIEADNLILAPGDTAAFLRSTHGSNNVQPAAFGEAVLFPSDAGTKVRSLQYQKATESWVARDMTLTHPEICYPGIVRMARMRNPHQMCLVLTEKGHIVALHAEGGLNGWSRLRLNNGHIKDMCVLADENGRDVLFLTVERRIQGERRLYLEAIPNFSYDEDWEYVDCGLNFVFETPTSTISGLDHLEGKQVHVSDRYRYVGAFTVESGAVSLVDGTGSAVTLSAAVVGLSHRSIIQTLPPAKANPGAMARFAKFAVRVIAGIRPIINGERPKDREPQAPLNLSQGYDYIKDLEVRTRGWTYANSIRIEEHLPFRVEILGVFGKLQQGKI